MHPESDRLRWLGVVDDEEKVRRLVGAEVLAAPSLGGESFGLVLVEAMAARTVVVASDIEGYRQAAGACAVLVPPGDPAALAAALRGVLAGRSGDLPAAAPCPDAVLARRGGRPGRPVVDGVPGRTVRGALPRRGRAPALSGRTLLGR